MADRGRRGQSGSIRRSVIVAAAYGQLGEQYEARKALRELLALKPDYSEFGPRFFNKWFQPEMVELISDGLRKAGLAIGGEPAKSGAMELSASGAFRAGDGFWVAVLPFKYAGSNADLTALADGLTEDIVTGLSRFSYLRVIARSSTSRFAQEGVDVRSAGKELGARYVMEGSLRQAGSRLRLAVQVVDTVSGANLWAESFERAFSADALFALQDDLVPRIVSTVADQSGVLTRGMSELLRSKSEDQLTPHEAVLRAFAYFERVTPDEHARTKRFLERAVHQAPDQADCWAMLSMLYRGEHAQGFNVEPDALGRAQAAAQRAIELSPSNHLGWCSLAAAHFFKKEFLSFRAAAERCIALNSMDGSSLAFLGLMRAYSGEWEEGCAQVEMGAKLNPNHPGWYRFATFTNAYRKGQYHEALEAAVRINMPGFFFTYIARAAAYGQLGQHEDAHKALKELLVLRPDFARGARDEFAIHFRGNGGTVQSDPVLLGVYPPFLIRTRVARLAISRKDLIARLQMPRNIQPLKAVDLPRQIHPLFWTLRSHHLGWARGRCGLRRGATRLRRCRNDRRLGQGKQDRNGKVNLSHAEAASRSWVTKRWKCCSHLPSSTVDNETTASLIKPVDRCFCYATMNLPVEGSYGHVHKTTTLL